MRILVVLAIGAALFDLLGCGGDDKQMDEERSGRTGSKICASFCQRVAKAGCENDDDERVCRSDCDELIGDTPKQCASEMQEYFTCMSKATFTCDSDDEAVTKSCAKELVAGEQCLEALALRFWPDHQRR